MRRVLLVVPVLALGLGACGESTTGSTRSVSGAGATSVAPTTVPTTTAAASPTEDFTGPVLASPTPSEAGPSVAPRGSGALPGVPAVTAHATDLGQQPTAAAGTGPAPTGLVIRDLVVGSGTAAVATDSVNVRYAGSLYTDGSVFDASWKDNEKPTDTTNFPLSGVVPGFAEGIVGMKPGGRREIVIPPALGYMDQATTGIPANSTLVFIVDLVSTGAAP